MIDGIQKLAKRLGESGCYWFSLVYQAEDIVGRELDAIAEAAGAQAEGLLGVDGYIVDASRALSDMVGARWTVIKAGPGHPLPLDYPLAPEEREILRYERPAPGGGEPLAHFVVGDGRGRVAWDPWPGSATVAQGSLVSRRVLRRVV